MSNKSVTVRNIKSGKTVWILLTKPDGSMGLAKRLLDTKDAIKQSKTIRAQFDRSPMWFSRRKALSHLKLYSPMRLPAQH